MTVSFSRRRLEQGITLDAGIIDALPDAIVLTDETRRIHALNAAAERLFGTHRSEVLGRNVEDCPCLSGILEAFTILPEQDSEPRYLECEIHSSTCGTLRAEVSTSTYHAQGSNYLVTHVRDISAQKERDERLRELEQLLVHAQKLEAIGRLAGGIAHDLNNVLTAILGYANSALASVSPRDPLYDDVREIEYGALRGSELTRQLLAFARRQVTEPKVVDLNALVLHAMKLLSRLIGEDVRVATGLASDLWQVSLDPIQFEQVLMNLVVNARDAMPTGGRILIETLNTTLDANQATRHGLSPGSYVTLCVRDEGIGMDAATLARIFEPFFTTKERGKGTGLGLPTSHAIVRQYGGQIEVESSLGEGAIFRVYLPRSKTGRSLAPSERPKAPTMVGNETVLLVEDDPQVRAVTARILRGHGYTVLLANDSECALSLAAEHKDELDLIVTDLVLPGASGAEIASTVRAACPSVRTLFMSGYAIEQLPHHNFSEGEAFLRKPFTPEELLSGVHKALGRA